MSHQDNIILLEDEKSLRETLFDYLSSKGFDCLATSSIQEAKAKIDKKFQIALIDIGLPDGSGLDFARYIRSHFPEIIILFLSALNDPETRLEGLEIGAMDYITKPFELKELSLRLEMILKSKKQIQEEAREIKIGNLEIYFSQYKVKDAHGRITELSQKECEILTLLYRNKNSTLSRDQIIDQVWGQNSYPSNRTVDNYIVKLRRWAETDTSDKLRIKSIRGIGYMMEIL